MLDKIMDNKIHRGLLSLAIGAAIVGTVMAIGILNVVIVFISLVGVILLLFVVFLIGDMLLSVATGRDPLFFDLID
jgi:hypothetical protein